MEKTNKEQTKMLWFRAGLTVSLTKEEYAEVTEGTEAGAGIIQAKIEAGDFALDGNSYIPKQEDPIEAWWPVTEEVDYDF